MYRTTKETIGPNSPGVKESYKPFRPYQLTEHQKNRIIENYEKFLSIQDGQDIDDYAILDNNKWEDYLSPYQPGSKMLLVGVGSGRELLLCKDMGFDVVGITLGSRNIDFGKDFLGLTDDEFIESTADAMPFEANIFDVVCAFQTLEHMISPSLFLVEQNRVLKLGGSIVLEWPPPKIFTGGGHGHHQICLLPGQVKALLEKNGFGYVELFYRTLENIPESEYWSDTQVRGKSKMLCARATKLGE